MSFATTSISFIDTLQFSKRMQKAGLEEKVANELAEAINESQSHSVERLATKEDLRIIEQTNKQEFKLFEQASRQENTSLKEDIKSLGQKIEQDIKSLGQKINQDIRSLDQKISSLDQKVDLIRMELAKDIEIAKKDMIIRLGSLIALAVGIIAALIKF